MIDLHSHIAFGVSDGPASKEDSLAMLEAAASDGVTHIVAVAHYGKYYDQLKDSVEQLRPEAERLGITLYPSFEYDYVHLDEIKNPEELVFIGPKCRYILLDFNRGRIPYSTPMRFFELSEGNVKFIVVHPEKLFRKEILPMLQQLAERGAVLQINAMSLLSETPPRERKMAHLLIRKGLVHAVASDAHRKAGVRRYVLREARKVVEKKYGGEIADLLFDVNPARILDDMPPVEMPTFPSWWERLRSRWTGR